MEDIRVVPDNSVDEKAVKAADDSSIIGYYFKCALIFCCFFCLIALTFFIWHQWESFSLSEAIDSGVWGTFGDFIGGVLGTIVALYSAYLLVRTFQDQIITNANVVKTNESSIATNKDTIESNKELIAQTHLQIFDSRFNTLLDLYRKSVEAYSWQEDGHTIHGRDAFDKMALSFRNMGYNNHTEYKRRSMGAVLEYRVLYASKRRELSVHFRMLYLLCKLTAEEKMKESYRVGYIKSIRGQLSEGELLLLRYNGYTSYGQKMCQYMNQFNLLKHLPIMSLLEFTYWRDMVGDERKVSAIDQVHIILKQIITKILDNDGYNSQTIELSSRYNFTISVNNNHDCITIDLIKFQKKKKGGAVKRPPEETALDAIKDNELRLFLMDFFMEMFVYSNFFQYNGENHNIVSVQVDSRDSISTLFHINVKNPTGKPLALAQRQVVPYFS